MTRLHGDYADYQCTVGGQCFTNEADLLTALSHTRQQSPEAQRNQTEKDRANQPKHGHEIDIIWSEIFEMTNNNYNHSHEYLAPG